MSHRDILHSAALIASRGAIERTFRLGAVGIRADGKIVKSVNGSTPSFNAPHSKANEPSIHAEYKLCRKLTAYSKVYVARIDRSGNWAMAKPCQGCMLMLQAKGIKRIFYTISPNEYGSIQI